MRIRTNTPSALDTVIRILSDSKVNCEKRSNNEVELPSAREEDVRVLLQEKLDEAKFDFANDTVLVNGNSIWSYVKITRELSRIKKRGSTEGISKYFYNFMHLNFTIAHYNIHGWAAQHPTWASVREVLEDANCPVWKTDVKKILEYVTRMQ